MNIEAGQLRKNLAIMVDNIPHIIADLEFVKPGKGQALYKCRLRNLVSGQLYDRTYRSGDRFETADVTESDIQYLYTDGDSFHFMHNETFEQMFMPAEAVGDAKNFLLEGMTIKALLYQGSPIGIDLPNFVVMEVVQSDPGVRGDTASGATKPASVESGYVLQVPLFISEGEYVKVDTRNGQYVERVKK